MKKTKYTGSLYAFIFLGLGITFLIIGTLCFLGVIKPTAHSSVQNPIIMGMVFSMIGVTFCAVQTILKFVSYKQEKLHNELLAKGNKLIGTVEKVYLQKGTRLGTKSPFRICYTYSYQSKIYHHKSCLLWDKPYLNEGDSIEVYANDFGKSTLKV